MSKTDEFLHHTLVSQESNGFSRWSASMLDHESPQALLDTINAPGFHMLDQWQAQKLAQVQLKASIALYSEIPEEAVARVHLEPISDLDDFLRGKVDQYGSDAPIAVLPEGPMTIPYLS
jgi:hypothetical protein